MLDSVARNLGHVGSPTFDRLCERFDTYDPQRYWIGIVTLALSEYAYYDEGDTGFWQGVCDRLNLQNTQGVQSALREVLDRGFQLWGVVETQKRNRYVSTLWLQSGIPQQNLKHFAQILEELSRQYDWWDIAHAEPEDLSRLLYEFCQEHHPQWRKLLAFLQSSCTDENEEAEPISGELLQGLALVAQALERQGLEPTVLQNPQQQEQLLQNFCLPKTFFLRNWDNLVRVLTPQGQHSAHRRNVISLRKKPLLLMLDIADSMDIQLVLPAQMLWKSDWRDLRGTYSQIQEQGWETTLPMDGALKIPELKLPINQISHEWVWHLRSHTHASLIEWRCEGVPPDFPVLFFDAWTGDRLISPNGLKGKTEIVCFYNRTIQLEISDGIEVVDSFVPCSISGWRGQQLQPIGEQAQLTIRLTHSTKVIHWDSCQVDYPQLRGLKLKRKEPVYLEVPSIWYPPVHLPKTISIQVEDLNNREVLTASNEQVSLFANSNWQQIALPKWIGRAGNYAVKLWSESDRWSEQFELHSSSEISQPSPISQIRVFERTNHSVEAPIQVSSSSEFWLEELTLRDLWVLEEVRFLLTNGQEEYCFFRQANLSGILSFNLAALRDVLPESDWYSLSYQRQGEERHSLLEMSTGESVSHTWARQAIHLSGLRPGQSYTLSLWNILRPEKPLFRLPLNNRDLETFTFPLLDSLFDTFGIFYIQLESSRFSPQSLGWWSDIQIIENLILPDDINDDYCFNILDNESLEDFRQLFKKVNLVIDCEQIRRAISGLQSSNDCLPAWLNRDLLLQKLQAILSASPPDKKPSPPPPTPKPQNLIYSLKIKNNIPAIRRAFCKKFTERLHKAGLQQQAIQLMQDKILPDLLRVKIENQQYLPILKTILAELESILHTSIELTAWGK
ncbi:MAG: hypothetical protein N4J56_006286 [Chroococcidiopsis sp. SAG 2025]|uniref:hypothetical protein n=1 Tax=Chroococcidiopsis sp. SAG 2025 TaxID=171389 RepID=UPI002936D8BB|nr:hypothetical protein [Chroococcidiopsis sp. SAG 2025]MDV2996632.1 hypothetical protein [Chroococcidiopsis sp. SAG 2025]